MFSASDSRAGRTCASAMVAAVVAVAAVAAAIALAAPSIAAQAHAAAAVAAPKMQTLRVCADPNNLPFSNARGEGFENELAALVADELGVPLRYTWWPQRRGFIRSTLRARTCDVVMGVPAGFELTSNTAPYYRSSYVFVTRSSRRLHLASLDDPRLRKLAIGVHVIGDDYSNVPPAQALAARGIVDNVHGYSIYGAYSQPDPPREQIDAVARGEVDVAIAWGPLAGYFAQREPVALDVTTFVSPRDPALATSFAIAMGVRRGDDALKATLQDILDRRRADVDRILRRYGVPRVDDPRAARGTGSSGRAAEE